MFTFGFVLLYIRYIIQVGHETFERNELPASLGVQNHVRIKKKFTTISCVRKSQLMILCRFFVFEM